MQRIVSAVALAGAALLAIPAQAQELSFSTGATITSDYIYRGITQTDGGPAFQPYAEAEIGGFYAGIWASNVDFGAGDPDRVELDAYLGFRNEIGAMSYDIGYVRYFYDDSGNCCGEFLFALGTELDSGLNLGLDLGYRHSDSTASAAMNAGYAFNDFVGVSGEVGRVQGSHTWWNAGTTIHATEEIGIDLRYHDSNVTSGRIAASVSFDLQLR